VISEGMVYTMTLIVRGGRIVLYNCFLASSACGVEFVA
jgi:hypothetical protein